MKFAISTALVALVALSSSASAACVSKRSRRSEIAERSTAGEAKLHARAFGAAPRRQRSVEKTVVRRQKSGWRQGASRNSAPSNASGPGGDSGNNGQSRSPSSSQSSPESSQTQGSENKGNYASSSAMTTPRQATATSSASKSTSTSSSGSSSSSSTSSSQYTGQATYFYQENTAGACGSTHSDTDYIVALQTSMYGSGSYCGKTLKITNTANSQSATATVADSCPGCSSSTSLDLSVGLFEALGDLDTGVLSIEWSFTD
ncbi:hypothetical protein JCM10213_009246 [Rhodosporidiobolus nylandii]